METPDHIAAVILAAGRARRSGSPKQLAMLNGRTLVQHVIDAARESGLRPIVVVLPPDFPLDDADLSRVFNAQPELGMSHSLRLGFAALPPDVAAGVILLGDQPTVSSALIHGLVAARGSRPLVATRAEGVLGPPVLLERNHFHAIEELTGDIGLRQVLLRDRKLVAAVDVPRLPADVDTPTDLGRLRKTTA